MLPEYPQTGGLLFFNAATSRRRVRYNKPPLSIDEQIALLKSRGITFNDLPGARTHLRHINYYRLTAYWLNSEVDRPTHTFKAGTTFESILNLYVFDREFKLLILDAVERVEVSLRCQWAYHITHNHGPHAYLNYQIAVNYHQWENDLERLKQDVSRSEEIFIKDYAKKYQQPDLPPAWAVCEVMSLGTLSRWLSNLKPMKTRSSIASTYKLDENVLQTFVHHLTYVRNICAHHSRLWNRQLTVTMQLPRTKPVSLSGSFNADEPRKIYNTLVMLGWILDIVSPENSWKIRLLDLIKKHGIEATSMGFPLDFESLELWRSGPSDR